MSEALRRSKNSSPRLATNLPKLTLRLPKIKQKPTIKLSTQAPSVTSRVVAAPAPAAPAWPQQQPTNGFPAFGAPQNSFVNEANFSNVFDNTDGQGQPQPQQPGKVLTGDLDSSLASLANNLSINKSATAQKPMQWSSPKNASKPGATWTPQPMQATTGAGYRPMGPGMSLPPLAHPYHPSHFVMQQPGMVMGMSGGPMMGMGMQAPMRPAVPPQPTNQFS